MPDLLHTLRDLPVVDTTYRRLRNVISGPGWGGFHRDRVYRALMLDLLDALPFTSFVETGTFRGYSTEVVARHRPALPVFTVEVVESTYQRSARALRRYANVTPMLGSSDRVVRQLLVAEQRLGPFPLFYLDAHWQTFWPLRDELSAIGQWGGKAVIVIDDFEVPGQPQFGFDVDGGGEQTAGHKCNLDYIRPALSPTASYHALLPKYSAQDAFGPPAKGLLRGHIALFQNAATEHATVAARPLAQRHYTADEPVRR
jgi:predicted O-methyltransferase YrrM